MAETLGSLIDKISILELRRYYMGLLAQKKGQDEPRRQALQSRLAVIEEQRRDLIAELDDLFADLVARRRRLKVYRQFKMYNDPQYRIDVKESGARILSESKSEMSKSNEQEREGPSCSEI